MRRTISEAVLSLCLLALLAACAAGPAAQQTSTTAGEGEPETTPQEATDRERTEGPEAAERADRPAPAARRPVGREMSPEMMRGVVFLTNPKPRDPDNPVLGARYSGKVVIDERGCVRIRPRGQRGDLPIWPAGYSLGTAGGEKAVLDEKDRVVVRVGSELVVGGGETSKGQGGGAYEELRRKLDVPARCQGPFWGVVLPVP